MFTEQLETAASATDELAEKAADAKTSLRLTKSASAMRQGSKVARMFKKVAATELEHGVRPSQDKTKDLAAR